MRKKLKSVLVAWQNEKWSSFHHLLTFSFFTNMAGFEYSTVVEQFMNGCRTVLERFWNSTGTVLEQYWSGSGTVLEQ